MTLESLMQVILGGVLAIVGGFASQWGSMHLERVRQRKQVAGALAGEIEAVCALVDRRKYVEVLNTCEQLSRAGTTVHIPPLVTLDFLAVFNAAPSAIGALPPMLARDTALFYTHVKAMLEDVRADRPQAETAEQSLYHAVELRKLLQDTMALGADLARRLHSVAA